MKYKDENGNWIDIHVKAIDSLPIGTILDYDGTEVPEGFEKYNAEKSLSSEIVENENGTAIKYSDGTMICTRTIEVNNVSVSQAWGSLFYYQDYTEYRFAQEFKDIPTGFYMHFTPTGAAGCWLGAYGEQIITKSGFSKFSLFRPTSNTVTGKLFVTAIGKWR